MNSDQLFCLKSWFDAYSQSYKTGDTVVDHPVALKIEHTRRVRHNICRIGRSIDLTRQQLHTAEAVGLLHDIGRFEQYHRFKTFNDRKSVNHATLGMDVLRQAPRFLDLAKPEQTTILDAIRYHNVRRLPANKPPEAMLFKRLIRDADKLDIWRVFAECYQHPGRPDATVVHSLPDLPRWNENILNAIKHREMAQLQHMQSLIDMKLLQLSWVFDINFSETFVQAKKSGHLLTIAQSLPDAPALRQAVSIAMNRLAQSGAPNSGAFKNKPCLDGHELARRRR
jgi:HD superfamily phosphohydrolase YqeK